MTPIQQLIDWGYWLVPWQNEPVRRPMVKEWQTKKPNALGFLRAYPDCDWAIVPTDTVVLDIEMKNGLDGERDLLEMGYHIEGFIGNPKTITKSNGIHMWFRQPPGMQLQGGHHIRPGIEAKALNGSVHIPPSKGYTTLVNLCQPTAIPVLPDNLIDAWLKSGNLRSTSTKQYKTETYPDGERRAYLCSMAGRLRNAGLVESELIAALSAIRDNRCENPSTFSDDEIVGIAVDYAKRPERTEIDISWFPKS